MSPVNSESATNRSSGNQYVVGSEITINGTASEGVDDAALYRLSRPSASGLDPEAVHVRRQGEYKLLDVDGSNDDDVWVSDDALPSISVSRFNTGTSSQKSIRVVDTELSANVQTVGGQVAIEDDEVNITGAALGNQNVDGTSCRTTTRSPWNS